MAIDWRGSIISLRQQTLGRRLGTIALDVVFEVYDGPTVLDRHAETWRYPLEFFTGMTLVQVRNLILNTGGPVETGVPDPDAPNPPALRARGAALVAEYEHTRGAAGIALPFGFGP
jgi:hypothetical protein